MDAEGLVGIKRSTRRLRIFGDQFQVAECRHQRDGEGDEEGQPDHAAHLVRDLAGQRIDSGAEDVSNDEK